jgi:predicted nuclease of predicted toxin-antitoxin system
MLQEPPEQIADIKANAQKREQRLLELSNNKIYRQLQEIQRKGNVNILAIAGEFVVTKNDYGVLRIHLRHGSNELVENIAIATDRMKRHGYMIDLLEKVEGKSCADSYNRTLKRTEEYKVNTKQSVNSIDRLIRDGAHQADVIVLRIDSDISILSLRDGIHNRAHRCSNLKEIIVIKNDKEAIYKRYQFCSDSFEIKQGDFQ